MIIEAICYFILACLMLTFTVVFVAICIMFRGKMSGRYLNRYFSISPKGGGVYELHLRPTFGFYYAQEQKFHKLLIDAIRKFRTGYPNLTLIATSLTLSTASRKGATLPITGIRLLGTRLLADVLILTNLANYRRADGEWCFIKLIRRVHGSRPVLFVLIGG